MADFPNIKAPGFPIRSKRIKERDMTESQAGYIQTATKFTRSRMLFELVWSGTGALTKEDFDKLDVHFDETNGAFNWIHPYNGKSYTVVYLMNELEFEDIGDTLFEGKIVIGER
jgi:hypothetical protein